MLRRIESRGAVETAHRAMQNCGQVFRYAVVTGRVKRDPTGDLRRALPPPNEKHHASIIERSVSLNFSGPLMLIRETSLLSARCGWRRWCLSDRASCAGRSGRRSIWKRPNGVSQASG